jgi:hypothetical protein
MTLKDKSWHGQGNCNQHPDPDLWHYENSVHADEQQLQVLRSVEAISLCRICPVKQQCLEEGMNSRNIEFLGGWGTIWGGLLMSERYLRLAGKDNTLIVKAEGRHRRNVRQKLAKLYG